MTEKTEIRDPGAPRTDEIARNVALHAIADHIRCEDSDADGQYCASRLLDDIITSVTWERDVNSAGVPVRRYVLRGEWLVDPEGEHYRREQESLIAEARAQLAGSPMQARVGCTDPDCPDFGDRDFGGGTCPADHALSAPVSEAVEADEHVRSRTGGMRDLALDLIEAFRNDPDALLVAPETTVRTVAGKRGVTL